MLRANFSDIVGDKNVRPFNWSPKEWRTKASYNFDERARTPFSILAGIAEKFWYENGDTFLTKNSIQFSDKPFTPSAEVFTKETYYDVIQRIYKRYLQEEGVQ